jgi:hypothetical protein
MGGGERRVSERINDTVRVTVQSSFQRRFVSEASKYVDKINAEINTANTAVMDISNINIETGSVENATVDGAAVKDVITKVFPGLGDLAAITIGAITVPVVGIIVAVVSNLINLFISNSQKEKKREEQRSAIRQQLLSSVFPATLSQLRTTVEAEINNQTEKICGDIGRQINESKNSLEKALADCRKALDDETAEKAAKIAEAEDCIEILERDMSHANE